MPRPSLLEIFAGPLNSLEIPYAVTGAMRPLNNQSKNINWDNGLSHLHQGAYRDRFTVMMKNLWDAMRGKMAFNLFRGSKLKGETLWRAVAEAQASGGARA